jgi:hypothetical protein
MLGLVVFVCARAWRGVPEASPLRQLFAKRAADVARHESGAGSAAADDGEEALLYRAGIALGLGEQDAGVRQRLIQIGRFLDLAPGSGDAAVGAARTLGLADGDTVIRRHVADLTRMALAQLPPTAFPTESELQQYYAKHAERFLAAERWQLIHVFLSADRRGAALEQDAARMLDWLRQGHASAIDAAGRGDPFLAGPSELVASAAELERTFGFGFSTAVSALPERQWSGPVRSSYGLHLVWIGQRMPARPRPFAVVRNQVLHELIRERSEEQVQARLRALRATQPGS